MNAKQVLLDILNLKQQKITSALFLRGKKAIPFLTSRDIEDLKGWSEKVCRDILVKMYYLRDWKEDSYTCPWCVKNYQENIHCIDCSYAKRHGCCCIANSTYGEITNNISFNPYKKRKIVTILGLHSSIVKLIENFFNIDSI